MKIERETTIIAKKQDCQDRNNVNAESPENHERVQAKNEENHEKEEIFSPVDGNDLMYDADNHMTRKRKLKHGGVKFEESTSSSRSTKTEGSVGRNKNKPNKARQNSPDGHQSLENYILRWSKEEKDLLRLKDTLLSNNVDFGDYSILMYETQDAFNHCRNLRLQIQISDQQVRLKTKQCNSLMAQREEMKRAEHQRRKLTQERESVLREKLRKTEQRLIDVYGENEWLQGKYEEMKALCIEYRDRYLSSSQHERINKTLNETREEAEESRQIIGIKDILGEEFGTKERNGLNEEENDKTILSAKEMATKEEDPVLLKKDTKQEKSESNNDLNIRNQRVLKENDIESIDDPLSIKKTIRDIQTVTARNDHRLFSLTQQCQKAFQVNSKKVTEIYKESQATANKLERWMENYMILKRKTEHTSDIYKRELKKSWESEKEYALQITQLCDTINDMSHELVDGKTTLATYTTHFDKVVTNLEQMEAGMVNLHTLYDAKHTQYDMKLDQLATQCDKLKHFRESNQQQQQGANKKAHSSSRRISKTLFNLKRRLGETNESGKTP